MVLHNGESPASFLGKGGANVATAAKLCGVAMVLDIKNERRIYVFA